MVRTRSKVAVTDARVGQLLQQARRQRMLSISQVSEQTKIPMKHLRALEEGELDIFRAEIYARGAFEKYTKFLGVYAESTQHAFQRVLAEARELVPLKVHTPRPWLQAVMTPRLVIAAALTGMALLVGSYVAWQLASFWRLPELSLLEPKSQVMTGDSVAIKGRADTKAEVSVNGEQVLLDSSGQFEKTLALRPGINIMMIQAKNAAGRIRTIERPILAPHVSK